MRIDTSGEYGWRTDLYDGVGDLLGENTRSGAVDGACEFTRQMLPVLERAVEHQDMTEDLAEVLSTRTVEIETRAMLDEQPYRELGLLSSSVGSSETAIAFDEAGLTAGGPINVSVTVDRPPNSDYPPVRCGARPPTHPANRAQRDRRGTIHRRRPDRLGAVVGKRHRDGFTAVTTTLDDRLAVITDEHRPALSMKQNDS